MDPLHKTSVSRRAPAGGAESGKGHSKPKLSGKYFGRTIIASIGLSIMQSVRYILEVPSNLGCVVGAAAGGIGGLVVGSAKKAAGKTVKSESILRTASKGFVAGSKVGRSVLGLITLTGPMCDGLKQTEARIAPYSIFRPESTS